ncbi:hypothetical protein ACQEVC_09205 [Plantactinospora sp. CA-294935]|uniref:hypothetical protein n=1 Tax=Plantactinospora sp. CA-294935 TaxID=3240012 RepID=UPI003D8AA748
MEKEKARVKRHQQDGPSILTKLRVALSIIVVAGVALQGCGEPQHLPPSSRETHGITLSDITAVVARDHAGRVVAELP